MVRFSKQATFSLSTLGVIIALQLFISLKAGAASAHSEEWRNEWPEMEELVTVQVTDNIHMVHGAGGTIAVFTGPEGILLVDSGHFRVLESRLYPSIKKIEPDKPVRYIINTHGHGDHGAGNTHFAKLGAITISHVIAREEFIDSPSHYPPLPPEGLPAITFNDKMTLRFNGQVIELVHAPFGHTRSDVIVYFKDENVIHTGDIFITQGYVSIAGMYKESKGATAGLIREQEMVLALGDENTKFVTGHARGIVSTRSELERAHKMLVTITGRLQKGIDAGRTLEEIKETRPTKEFDNYYAWPGMSPERTVENYYYGIVGNPPPSTRRFKE